MNRFLRVLCAALALIFSFTAKAQLDTEHYFAPMYDATVQTDAQQWLYLSTNQTQAFPVQVFSNNILVATVNISKGNPQRVAISRDLIITRNAQLVLSATPLGLHVQGPQPFFANLRFSEYNHAEIITSKGKNSIGKEFRVAAAPITVNNAILNFTCGILATEDNTSVTVSEFSPAVTFANGTSGLTTRTFTLNKGQSYIFAGKGNLDGNLTGFIGAKIVATKPVSVTNGNFDGQYAGNFPNASDILMDQSVPVNQLGQTFGIVRGNGVRGAAGTNAEQVLVVATANNTQVFVNNETAPIATLNAGQYAIIPDDKYIDHGNGHLNMYVNATQPIYTYQLLSGTQDQSGSEATGGFNFIPPLNCFLPNTIGEIGLINQNPVVSNAFPNGTDTNPTKLNIITESGATVQINGNPLPAGTTGPFPLPGTNIWETYTVPNVSGNITITSTKSVTAGIIAGSGAVGYGGFFAGFDTLPRIIQTGTCIPGVVLTVSPQTYTAYRWKRNGVDIPGAVGPSYTPLLPGDYSCVVVGCTEIETPAVRVLKCMVNSTKTLNICSTTEITPEFSSPSIPQPIDINSIRIVTAPANGTATINPSTGVITYTRTNATTAGTDSFVFTFCGAHPDFPECETVTVNISFTPLITQDATLRGCTVNGLGTFNLTTANVTAAAGVTKKYYPTLLDAQNQNAAAEILNPQTYATTVPSTVFVLIKNSVGCQVINQITLEGFPEISFNNVTPTFCDDDFDGIIPVNLAGFTPQLVNNSAYFTVRYYTTLAAANAGGANNISSLTINTTTVVYVRVDSPDGCPFKVQPLTLTVNPKLPLTNTTVIENICDEDSDGIMAVNLGQFVSSFTTQSGATATFYTSLANAQNSISPLPQPVLVNGSGLYYARISAPGFCDVTTTLNVVINKVPASALLKDATACNGSTVILNAGLGYDAYLWSTGATTPQISVGPGVYTVTLTKARCSITQTVKVSVPQNPVITMLDIKDGTLIVHVEGGTPPYEYSLDEITWQESNIFSGLSAGNYTVFVRDQNQCVVLSEKFSNLKLINTITPNADGINDSINFSQLMMKENPVFKIFDRYGALVFEGHTGNRFTWNGLLNTGARVPTATYWYYVEWNERNNPARMKYSSWLLVKNFGERLMPE